MPETSAPATTELEEAVKLMAYHQEQKDLHDQKIKESQAAIRAILGTPVRGIKIGSAILNWSPPKRVFDEPRFKSMYPPEANPTLYKQTLNNDMIPKSLKDQFMVPGNGEGTVTLK